MLGIAGITAASTGCVANGDELPLAAALQEVAVRCTMRKPALYDCSLSHTLSHKRGCVVLYPQAWLPKKALFGAAPSHHMETVPNNELVLLRINDATTGRSAQAIAEAVQAAFQTLLVTQADVAQYKAQVGSCWMGGSCLPPAYGWWLTCCVARSTDAVNRVAFVHDAVAPEQACHCGFGCRLL